MRRSRDRSVYRELLLGPTKRTARCNKVSIRARGRQWSSRRIARRVDAPLVLIISRAKWLGKNKHQTARGKLPRAIFDASFHASQSIVPSCENPTPFRGVELADAFLCERRRLVKGKRGSIGAPVHRRITPGSANAASIELGRVRIRSRIVASSVARARVARPLGLGTDAPRPARVRALPPRPRRRARARGVTRRRALARGRPRRAPRTRPRAHHGPREGATRRDATRARACADTARGRTRTGCAWFKT